MKIKQIREKIQEDEKRLQRLMSEMEKLWEDSGLNSKDPSYLVEKTMRFELAQKSVITIFAVFKGIIDDYKKLCLELEKSE